MFLSPLKQTFHKTGQQFERSIKMSCCWYVQRLYLWNISRSMWCLFSVRQRDLNFEKIISGRPASRLAGRVPQTREVTSRIRHQSASVPLHDRRCVLCSDWCLAEKSFGFFSICALDRRASFVPKDACSDGGSFSSARLHFGAFVVVAEAFLRLASDFAPITGAQQHVWCVFLTLSAQRAWDCRV